MANGILYPGTFDPITNGHVDLVRRALELFDEVIVAMAENTAKAPHFPLAKRLQLAQTVLADFPQVRVMSFAGLTVDFAEKLGVKAILRGLRAVSDFDFEFQLANMNRIMNANIETIFLPAAGEETYVSSSLVCEISSLGGDVSPFVDKRILNDLKS